MMTKEEIITIGIIAVAIGAFVGSCIMVTVKANKKAARQDVIDKPLPQKLESTP